MVVGGHGRRPMVCPRSGTGLGPSGHGRRRRARCDPAGRGPGPGSPGTIWVGVDVGGTNVRAGVEDQGGHMLSWVSYPHRMTPGQFHAIPEAAGKRPGRGPAGVGGRRRSGSRDSRARRLSCRGGHGRGQSGMARPFARSGAFGRLGRAGADRERRLFLRRFRTGGPPGGPALPWLYLSVGTGVGACLVLEPDEGRLLCLNVGHLPVPGGSRPCPCGKHGCLETVASGTAFTRAAADRIAADPDHRLNARAASLTGKDVVDAALQGTPSASRCWLRPAQPAATPWPTSSTFSSQPALGSPEG